MRILRKTRFGSCWEVLGTGRSSEVWRSLQWYQHALLLAGGSVRRFYITYRLGA